MSKNIDSFSLCDKCSQRPWSSATWDKLAAGEEVFEYEVSFRDVENGARGKCWWCCVVLDTVPSFQAEQQSNTGSLNIELRFEAPIRLEPKRYRIVNLRVERPSDLDGSYEVRQVGISASQPASDSPICVLVGSDALSLNETGVDMTVVRQWLHHCVHTHDECRQPTAGFPAKTPSLRPMLPTRLVHIQMDHAGVWEASVRKSSIDETGDYLALSYRWGGPQHMILTSATIQDFTMPKGLSFSTLPQGLRDALLITYQLGHQYLWVDALCILKDSSEDKNREIASMQDYYSNATLVIQPSGMLSVADGFLGRARIAQYEPEYFLENVGIRCPNTFELPSYEHGHQSPALVLEPRWYDPSRESVNTRAWVLQERLLCPRVLIFPSVGGAIFQCEETETFQGRIYYHEDQSFVLRGRDRLQLKLNPGEDGMQQIWHSWSRIVSDYSRRDLSDPFDKLHALAGLATVYLKIFPTQLGSYAFGHWEHLCLESLLWNVEIQDLRPKPKVERAPSWSWVSVDNSRYRSSSMEKGREVDVLKYCSLHSMMGHYNAELPIALRAGLTPVYWAPSKSRDKVFTICAKDSYDSDVRSDCQVFPDCIEERPAGFERVWCMLMSSTHPYRRGLVLKPVPPHCFRRVGYFSIYSPEGKAPFDGAVKQVVTLI